MKKSIEDKGITLVALVITVIILIILAGIGISMVLGDNGLINKAKNGAESYKNAANEEQNMLKEIDTNVENLLGKNLNVKLENKNIELVKINNTDEVIGENGNKPDTISKYNLKINKTFSELSYTWSSSDNNVATVDSTGEITAISSGTATITCIGTTMDGKEFTDKCDVKVIERLYLYYYGNEFTSVTGGWKRGNYNTGSFTKHNSEGYINLYFEAPNDNKYYNSMETTNTIDITGYSKLKSYVKTDQAGIYISNENMYWNWLDFGCCSPKFDSYSTANNIDNQNVISNWIKKSVEPVATNSMLLAECDISSTSTKSVYPTWYFRRWYSDRFTMNLDMYEMFLEK